MIMNNNKKLVIINKCYGFPIYFLKLIDSKRCIFNLKNIKKYALTYYIWNFAISKNDKI